MQTRGPLMIEHRLIERMLSVIRNALSEIKLKNKVDPVFVDIAVDFIRIYADRKRIDCVSETNHDLIRG
jgi:hemerythrin-like domain-containing protein